MPAGIAGVVRTRKPHRKGSEIWARLPASPADKLIEGRMERGTVHRALERFVTIIAESDDWPGPGRRIIGIAWQVTPQDGAAFIRKLSRESTFDPDKSVVNELLDLRVAKHTRGVLFVGRHECPHLAWPTLFVR